MSHLRRLLYTLCLLTLTGTLLLAQQPKKSAAVRKLEKQRTELLNAIKKTDKEIKSLGQSLSDKNKQDKLVRKQIKDRQATARGGGKPRAVRQDATSTPAATPL